jgi:hypothetical protein
LLQLPTTAVKEMDEQKNTGSSSEKAGEGSDLSPDDLRIWEELWSSGHTDHYACTYEEAVAEFLVSRWRLLDTVSKFLTAFTASGSSIAAWAIWASSTNGAIGWAVISGVAAVIALIHLSFGISDRIKEDTLIFATFQQLRLDLEIFQKKMLLRQNETLTAYINDYMDIAGKFGKAHALKRPDFFLTNKRQQIIQAQEFIGQCSNSFRV